MIMTKRVLVFGAGKSATVLIDYLLGQAEGENWEVTVADAQQGLALEKIGGHARGRAVGVDIREDEARSALVAAADLVISLLPPALHLLVAEDCLRHGKDLLTASYVDEAMRALQPRIEAAGLLFLCEMGLDPGIDHMSAKQMIDGIEEEGGKITSFLSHCGGLVAPESDTNPWHYKISWNPRNVVMAGKAGAIYRLNGEETRLEYEALFAEKRYVMIPGHDVLCWYPNRDSLSYIPLYGLHDTATFVRTTLRHPDFIYGWKNIIDLQLTSEQENVDTREKSLLQFFKEHMERHGFSEWLEQKLHSQFDATKSLLTELVSLVELEQKASDKGLEPVEEFMLVDEKGDLKEVDIDDLKINAASTLADRMHDASLTLKQLLYLGMDDGETLINKGVCTPADVLQLALEKKLALLPGDRDRVVMVHEIEFEREGSRFKQTATLVLDGQDDRNTAMAKTVGLPLGVAAKLILNGTIRLKGLHIPLLRELYEPLLQELARLGIVFREERTEL
jgi:saccharopine dehydrogenase-like NADP-dependent oxidoreductase